MSTDEALTRAVDAFSGDLEEVIFTPGKHARSEAIDGVRDRCVEKLCAGIGDEEERAAREKAKEAIKGGAAK